LVKRIKEIEDQEKRRVEEEERAKQEKAKRDEENRREAARQEEERRRLQAERERLQQSGRLCDDLAANPTDPRRATNGGVPHDVLRTQVDAAIGACQLAIQQYPNELRFQYQFARAVAFKDRKKALQIHQQLARQKYPAAPPGIVGSTDFCDR